MARRSRKLRPKRRANRYERSNPLGVAVVCRGFLLVVAVYLSEGKINTNKACTMEESGVVACNACPTLEVDIAADPNVYKLKLDDKCDLAWSDLGRLLPGLLKVTCPSASCGESSLDVCPCFMKGRGKGSKDGGESDSEEKIGLGILGRRSEESTETPIIVEKGYASSRGEIPFLAEDLDLIAEQGTEANPNTPNDTTSDFGPGIGEEPKMREMKGDGSAWELWDWATSEKATVAWASVATGLVCLGIGTIGLVLYHRYARRVSENRTYDAETTVRGPRISMPLERPGTNQTCVLRERPSGGEGDGAYAGIEEGNSDNPPPPPPPRGHSASLPPPNHRVASMGGVRGRNFTEPRLRFGVSNITLPSVCELPNPGETPRTWRTVSSRLQASRGPGPHVSAFLSNMLAWRVNTVLAADNLERYFEEMESQLAEREARLVRHDQQVYVNAQIESTPTCADAGAGDDPAADSQNNVCVGNPIRDVRNQPALQSPEVNKTRDVSEQE